MYVPPADLADAGAEARIVRETVDQIVLADRQGWDYVWLTEHHFLQQFSHVSAPEILFSAAAYATAHPLRRRPRPHAPGVPPGAHR